MMGDFERIAAHYTFTEGRDSLLIKKEDGQNTVVPFREVIFAFGNKGITSENVADAINKGLALRVNGIDFVAWYLGWDDEKKCKVLNGFGLRTAKYIEKLKVATSFTRLVSNWDEPNYVESVKVVAPYANASDPRIGRVADGTWCYSYGIQTDIDDYTVNKFFFTRKPSGKEATLVNRLIDIEVNLSMGKLPETFNCWECGRTTHWLDLEGDVNKKASMAADRYCGC